MTACPAAAAALALLLAARGAVARKPHKFQKPLLHHEEMDTIPVKMYAQDCGQSAGFSWLAVGQRSLKVNATAKAEMPGAGMDPDSIEPFTRVMKDGFFFIQCTKDLIYKSGDKYGDNADSYILGKTANISIVHYTEHVPKEDRQDMSHETCFAFCRTVPDMAFFGIVNGNDCYCAPYFQPSGSANKCETACPGNKQETCGGPGESSIFSMHECGNTQKKLMEARETAQGIQGPFNAALEELEKTASMMQESAERAQKVLSKFGDSAATKTLQRAKIVAGQLEQPPKFNKPLGIALQTLTKVSGEMAGADFYDFEVVKKADKMVSDLKRLAVECEDSTEEFQRLTELVSWSGTQEDAVAAGKQYVPITNYIHKDYLGSPSTCSGTPVAAPLTGVSYDECAGACNKEYRNCVGFSYYGPNKEGSKLPSLCFLMGAFEEVTYYTKCEEKGGFLQKKATVNASSVTAAKLPFMLCSVKFGTYRRKNIVPDPSCTVCLKKMTEEYKCPDPM